MFISVACFKQGRINREINRRFHQFGSSKILGTMSKLTRNVNLSIAAKLATYKEVFVFILMYFNECWDVIKKV